MYTISEVENNLIGLLHSGSLIKVRNINQLYERAANNLLSKVTPLETMRLATLASTVHDAQFNYALPTDYRSLVGIYPQAGREISDKGQRIYADQFDRAKSVDDKKISIEGINGAKIVRIDWAVKSPKTLNNLDSLTGNGTWAAVAGATNVVTDTIYKYSGSGSIKLDVAATGDGIDNTTMNTIDLSNEDNVADVYIPIFIKDATDLAKVTSVTLTWGNDLTTNYWIGVAQTAQADGTAFRVGWNTIKVPWSTASETGTVVPSTINSAKITFTITGAITQLRVDNIIFSIGYPFDIKYYSKYLFQTSAGVWISQPTTSTDVCVLDNDAFNIFLYECLDEAAHQVEGEDSNFDMRQASKKLWGDSQAIDPLGRNGLYAKYRVEHPSQKVKIVGNYGGTPRYRNSLRGY